MAPPFLNRVVLKNYKSIGACSVALRPLTFLVGPNGSGKSNFLDALRFVADSLRTSLEHALRERGGIKEVRRRSVGHPTHFGIRLDLELPTGERGHYSFSIGARQGGGFEVSEEECSLAGLAALDRGVFFKVRAGQVIESSSKVAPAASSDRLYLVNASGLPEFRPVYEALSHMGFYSLAPDRIRDIQQPDAGELLARDGSNLASVLAHMSRHSAPTKRRIEEYLAKVVPGVVGVDAKAVGPKETLEFRQSVGAAENPWRFIAANMSDGTLRTLGNLVALFQSANGAMPRVPLVAIEEPEVALHPAAASLMLECLVEASQFTQVLVTSHSADLLEDASNLDSILAVVADEGMTRLGPLDEAGASALKDRLYTPGQLLRLNQLVPDREASSPKESQLKLFEHGT